MRGNYSPIPLSHRPFSALDFPLELWPSSLPSPGLDYETQMGPQACPSPLPLSSAPYNGKMD